MFKIFEQGFVYGYTTPGSLDPMDIDVIDVSYDLRFKCADERRTLEVAKLYAAQALKKLLRRKRYSDLHIVVEELDNPLRNTAVVKCAVNINEGFRPVHSFFIEECE